MVWQSMRHGHTLQLALTRLLQDGEYGSTKSTAAEIASGFPLIVTAAERRAHAVYYSFTLLCIGLLVLLVVVLIESHRWRSTITTESEVSYTLPGSALTTVRQIVMSNMHDYCCPAGLACAHDQV